MELILESGSSPMGPRAPAVVKGSLTDPKDIFIFNNEKFNHSKKIILVEVPDKIDSMNKKILEIKLSSIPNITIIVDPLRPNILPNVNTIKEMINGKKVTIKYN